MLLKKSKAGLFSFLCNFLHSLVCCFSAGNFRISVFNNQPTEVVVLILYCSFALFVSKTICNSISCSVPILGLSLILCISFLSFSERCSLYFSTSIFSLIHL